MNRPDVDILLVTWNALPYLKRCIHSIRNHTRSWPYRLIVVDNGSTDGTSTWLKRQKDVTYSRNRMNLGVTRATNQALGMSKAPWLVRLGDDSEVTPRWLDKMWEAQAQYRRVGAVGCQGISPTGRIQITDGLPGPPGWTWNGAYELDREQRCYLKPAELVSGCILLDRNVLKSVGLYDTRLSDQGEDTDFLLRLRLAGFRIIYQGKARVIYHQLGRRRLGRVAPNLQYFYRKWRNYPQFPLPDSEISDRCHLLALRALAKGLIRKALSYLKKLDGHAPNLTTRFLEGLTYFHLRQYRNTLNRLASLNHFSSRAAYLTGILYNRLNRDEEAILFMKRAIKMFPKFTPSHLALSSIYAKRKEQHAARFIFEQDVFKDIQKMNGFPQLGNASWIYPGIDWHFCYPEAPHHE